jgi:hypothetical protein
MSIFSVRQGPGLGRFVRHGEPGLDWIRSNGMPLVRRTLPRLHRIDAATATFFRSLVHGSVDQRRTA